MGNRLIHFLATVLPTHHHYNSRRPEHARLRVKIQHDLMTVREQVEDVAFKLDKEYYRELMKKEGLEFVVSPERMSVREMRKKRVRKVKFNLDSSQQLVYHPHVDDDDLELDVHLNVSGNESFESEAEVIGNTAINTRKGMDEMDMDMDMDMDIDLEGWGDRDPDIVGLSFSSDEASSSFESSFAIMEDENEVEGRGSFDFGIGNGNGNTASRTSTRTDNSQKGPGTLEDEFLNVFGGIDDGWEHYDANKASDEILEWPEMSGGFPSRTDVGFSADKESEQDTTGSTADLGDSSVSENDVLNQSSFVSDDDNSDDGDDSSRSSQDSESSGSDSEAGYNAGNSFVNQSFSSGISESFVEKISRENFCRPIDELQDHDDESAQDSWAQNQHDDLDISIARQEGPHHVIREQATLVSAKVAAVRSDHLNHDDLESSIDGHNTSVDPMLASSVIEDQQPTFTDLPRAQDLLKPLHGDQSLDYSNESQSSLEFSYASSKNYLTSSAEDFTNTDLNSSNDSSKVLKKLHDEFDNSQIIAESPSFEYISEDDDEDSDHDEFIRSMTEEFTSDQSDSSKTFGTASTTDSSRSGMSVNKYNPQNSKENLLGIVRRDAYIPTIDSPSLPRKQLGDELDYLESKVKNLQGQQSKDYSNGAKETKKTTMPLQVARDEHNLDHNRSIEDLQRIQSPGCSKESNQVDCLDNKIVPTEEKSEEPNSILNYGRGRRHPTAARLKVLRQSSAWKRRYGKAEKD